MNLEKPHTLVHEYLQAMMLVLAFIQPQHVTILGLGGGCLLRSLYHILPDCELHAVELRQCVYDVAIEFFGLPISNNIKVTISDGKQYLKNTDDATTDIIFSDMYNANGTNLFQFQKHFLNECHRVLRHNGWLVVNYQNKPDRNSSFCKYLHILFLEVFIFRASSDNYIIFAGKQQIDSLSQFELIVATLEKK